MEHKNLPFPPAEESSSRYVKQRAKRPQTYQDLADEKQGRVETWRRILLANAMRALRVEEMPPLLLDQLIDKILYADREEIYRFSSLVEADWERPEDA